MLTLRKVRTLVGLREFLFSLFVPREKLAPDQVSRRLTCFSGELHEGVHPLLSVAALRGNSGDVVPAHGLDDVDHRLSLETVRRDHAREEVVPPVVTQLRGCGCIADLRDLQRDRETQGLRTQDSGPDL